MMVTAGHSASLALLLSIVFGVADAIRTLKDGPMIDAEGREYKSGPFKNDAENSGPDINEESSVRVECTDATMIVLVKADLYKNGRLMAPGDFFLGEVDRSQRSRCRAVAVSATDYVIEAGLQDCGSMLTISEDSVIYSNKLIISPAPRFPGITRMAHGEVPVYCLYKRTHLVSSHAHEQFVAPSSPLQSPAAGFSLKLMAEDWKSETTSSVFYVGDLLHLEASYSGPDSGQRRLFIDSCVATLTPDAESVPRYFFIGNYGCLADAKEGGTNTHFQPRTRTSALQLQLEAFLFHQDSRNSIFITCQLKATSEMWKSSPIYKACDYVHSRWINVDGSDVCRCCDATCFKSPPNNNEDVACGTVTLGPVMVYHRK